MKTTNKCKCCGSIHRVDNNLCQTCSMFEARVSGVTKRLERVDEKWPDTTSSKAYGFWELIGRGNTAKRAYNLESYETNE